jgi:hypothetical protein
MEESLNHYRKLVSLTKDTYLYANSMQTGQRRIPIGGDDGKYKTWQEMLPLYEKEFENFKENLLLLKMGNTEAQSVKTDILSPAEVKVFNSEGKWISLSKGVDAIEGINSPIKDFAPELGKMSILKMNADYQKNKGTNIEFECEDSVKLLIGYFRTDEKSYARAPMLEMDASANDYGQSDPVLINALYIEGQPAVNIHAYSFPAGRHKLSIEKGICLVLGFTQSNIKFRNAGLMDDQVTESVDWLFY